MSLQDEWFEFVAARFRETLYPDLAPERLAAQAARDFAKERGRPIVFMPDGTVASAIRDASPGVFTQGLYRILAEATP